MKPADPQSRTKRSLSHVGGETATAGDPEASKRLARALDVPVGTSDDPPKGEDSPDRAHVHGFHTYPARMHPVTASRLVKAFAPPGAVVLDPFCGSGTVLVEAMLAGRNAVGTDLNPLAVMLARLKTQPLSREHQDTLVACARDVAAFADARRTSRAGATRRLAQEDVALFDPHVLLELDGLRAGVAAAPAEAREGLSLVLSAILVKLSKQQGDTSARVAPRRIAAGFAAKLFVSKTEELARRLEAFTRALPPGQGASRVKLDDATRLRTLEPKSIDAVITSPPYVATYDYLAHHALRLRWLDLDARDFERGELGARRTYALLAPDAARKAWEHELDRFLRAVLRVVRPGASVVLLIGDSAVGDAALRADEMVARVAPRARFAVVARASQQRPHFHGPTEAVFRDAPRAEHALLLKETGVFRR